MADLSSYPFPTYIANKLVACLFSSLVFLSLIIWCLRSIANFGQPIRLTSLLFVAHVTILSELTIRATTSMTAINSRTVHIVMTVLYTVGQRSIIAANLTCLLRFANDKFRYVFIGMSVSIIVSDIFMAPAGLLAFEAHRTHLSFIFRQISTSIVCVITVAFYFLWFWTKVLSLMPCEIIVLLLISSLNCLLIAFFLLVMSIPAYYIRINDDEEWFYFFQVLPVVLTLITWSMLHPTRYMEGPKKSPAEEESDETTSSYVF